MHSVIVFPAIFDFHCTFVGGTVGAGKEVLFVENSRLGDVENLDFSRFRNYNKT